MLYCFEFQAWIIKTAQLLRSAYQLSRLLDCIDSYILFTVQTKATEHEMLITNRGAQKKCVYSMWLQPCQCGEVFINGVFSSCVSARCGHAASGHNRQVSFCLFVVRPHAHYGWKELYAVVCGYSQSCVSSRRYSGSGSSGAASMRKVGQPTMLRGCLCV